MKPFLILQLRPETRASDEEYEAILSKGGLLPGQTRRIRLDQGAMPEPLKPGDYSGIIVGGGPGCVSDPEEKKTPLEKQIEDAVLGLMPLITEHDVPFLGCCYGIGILAHHLGARVSKERYGEEVGAVECHLTDDGKNDPLLTDVPARFMAFVGHKEAVQELPSGCTHLLASGPCPFQMIRYKNNVYATQFHPEADSDVFEARVNIYKNYGYFAPEDAQRIIDFCHQQVVDAPQTILRRFVSRYSK